MYEKAKNIKNDEFISVNVALPETNDSQWFAHVYMKRSNGGILAGLFYINGGQPVFSALGTHIIDVIAWTYR